MAGQIIRRGDETWMVRILIVEIRKVRGISI